MSAAQSAILGSEYDSRVEIQEYMNDSNYCWQRGCYHGRGNYSRSFVPGRISTPSSSNHSSPITSDVDDDQRSHIDMTLTDDDDEEEKCDFDRSFASTASSGEEDRHHNSPLTLWCYPPSKKSRGNARSPCIKPRHQPAIQVTVTKSFHVEGVTDCKKTRMIAPRDDDSPSTNRHRRHAGQQDRPILQYRDPSKGIDKSNGEMSTRVTKKKLSRTHMKKRRDSSWKETANDRFNNEWWIGEDGAESKQPTPAVKVVPLKSRDENKQMEVHINAEHYDRATWRMYNRITRSRLVAQQSCSSLPPVELHLPGGNGKSYAQLDRASILGVKSGTYDIDVPAGRDERKRSCDSLNDDIFSLDLET